MGSEISCELKGFGDICYNQAVTYNNNIPALLESYYIFNNEVKRTKNQEIYYFSCLDGSEEVPGELNCNVDTNATISCGKKLMSFRHKNNCSFGFMFRTNDTLIFQSDDLSKPLISFPSISNQVKLYSNMYSTYHEDSWAVREGYKGGEFESYELESQILNSESELENQVWNGEYLSVVNSTSVKFPRKTDDDLKNGSQILDNNGSLSFILPSSAFIEGNLRLSINGELDDQIVTLDISKCCFKLSDVKHNKVDKHSYETGSVNLKSVNLTLSWISSILFLFETSSMKPLSIITSIGEISPFEAKLIDTVNQNNQVATNWYIKKFDDVILPNYCILSTNTRCKSSEVNISGNLSSDLQYLRYGFMFSGSMLAPFVMNIRKNSEILATLTFNKNSISVVGGSNSSTIILPNQIEDGDFASGDIFVLSKELHKVVISDSSILCKEYSNSCLSAQDNDWMSKASSDSILRYAYLKRQAFVNQLIESKTGALNEETSQLKDDYYMYVSFRNCIIAKIGVNSAHVNNVLVTNSQNVATIVHWRINDGISPSIAIPSDKLSTLKDNIKNKNYN